jgi:hypothetical protein
MARISGGAVYPVKSMSLERRYVQTTPVECAVFHLADGTVQVVRLDPDQLTQLRQLITYRLQALTAEAEAEGGR